METRQNIKIKTVNTRGKMNINHDRVKQRRQYTKSPSDICDVRIGRVVVVVVVVVGISARVDEYLHTTIRTSSISLVDMLRIMIGCGNC